MSRRFCFTLGLKDDPALIAEHRKQHEKILRDHAKLKGIGIEDLEIYLLALVHGHGSRQELFV